VSSPHSPRRQTGITVIGFLLLAVVFGVLAFAVLKIVPLYMERMRVQTVLQDVKAELDADSAANTVQGIRSAIGRHFYIENLDVPREEILIAREGEGYTVRVVREARAPFIADLSFVVDIDEQIELGR
jgi:hypothetical protein